METLQLPAALFISSIFTFQLSSSASKYRKAWRIRDKKSYIPYSNQHLQSCIAVDCSHPSILQLTHHLRDPKIRRLHLDGCKGDSSSTDAVLNAIKNNHPDFLRAKHVTTNHFDIDSFLSVWCALNPDLAVLHEDLLRTAARIGDFREAIDLTTNTNTDLALRIVCWINSVERKEFYRPFEEAISASDGEAGAETKLQYFLPLLTQLLQDKDDLHDRFMLLLPQYWTEYSRVVSDYMLLLHPSSTSEQEESKENELTPSITTYSHIGLTIVHVPRPLHYYALFSATVSTDMVLAVYSDNRVEIEQKYTAHVSLGARKTLPKVDMRPLAKHLTVLECSFRNGNASCEWHADGPTDSGPLLRLEHKEDQHRLSKAERYANPFERRILSTMIPVTLLEETALSYFEHAYHGYQLPSYGDRDGEKGDSLTWRDIQEFNRGIDWQAWQAPRSIVH